MTNNTFYNGTSRNTNNTNYRTQEGTTMMNNTYNNRAEGYNYTDINRGSRRPRFVEEDFFEAPAPRPEKKKSRVGLVMATIALTLVAVVATGAIVLFATKDTNRLTAPPQTTVATANVKEAPKADAPAIAAAQTATQEQTQAQEQKQTQEQAPTQTETPAMAVAKRAYAGHNLEQTNEQNIIRVDGERIYMDTKRLAPENTGAPAHYYANGKTSYGFDWTYNTDNSNFVLACNYNFAKQQYDFTFYGTKEGKANVTVYYNTDDNTKVPVQLTINVDSNLNVTQG